MRIQASLLLLVSVLAVTPTVRADSLFTANFSGGVFNPTASHPAFDGICATSGGCQAVSGSLVYDASLVPGPSSGFVNVFFSDNPDIGSIPAATAFNIQIGPDLSFTLADADGGAAAIQYLNGSFKGLFFVAEFSYQSTEYQFLDEGGVWSIFQYSPTEGDIGSPVASGYINFGLTGVEPYNPGGPPPPSTPEPSALALLGTGMLGIVGLAYRRRAQA